MVVISCEFVTNIILTNADHESMKNAGLGFCEPLVIAFLPVDQYITFFYVFLLKTPYLMNTHQHYNSCLDKVYLTHVFFPKAHHSFFVFRTALHHYTWGTFTILNSPTNKKCKKVVLKKDTCFQYENWNEKAEPHWVSLNWKCAHRDTQEFSLLCMCLWLTTTVPWGLTGSYK